MQSKKFMLNKNINELTDDNYGFRRYKILKTMSNSVSLRIDTITNVPVVMKKYKTGESSRKSDANKTKYYNNEYKIYCYLNENNYEHCPKLIDTFTESSVTSSTKIFHALVLENLDGKNLYTKMQDYLQNAKDFRKKINDIWFHKYNNSPDNLQVNDKPMIPHILMPISEIKQYFKQIIMAIDRLHKLQVLHGDIKPENLIIVERNACNAEEKPMIYIIDFEGSNFNGCNELFGTLDYLSPESVSGKYRSLNDDIWSLGVILYEMLSGYLPFYADTRRETMDNIRNINYSFIEGVREYDVDYDESGIVINKKEKPIFCDLSRDLISRMLQYSESRIPVENILKHEWLYD